MYAIRNKKTKKWVFGTDHRYSPLKQRTSHEKAIIFGDKEDAEHNFNIRKCNKDYEIVKVELKIIQELVNNELV
ncbi:hypothetical protein SAMN02745248_02416 [Hathewaya proteolytica DSM 3090]|uniref:Uncharacterized protein n=1 Tax=Hathewaya proteolytica DSM 3090 TaxID=1121331 RepID=A0A1M6S0Y6_9CLOT|nr:hypothetical protein [Hathewaya proteolytica]SHK38345.1 hypothetical protein SAMN02745248_02416 [Hathewaya proteolytica DSM 3090]